MLCLEARGKRQISCPQGAQKISSLTFVILSAHWWWSLTGCLLCVKNCDSSSELRHLCPRRLDQDLHHNGREQSGLISMGTEGEIRVSCKGEKGQKRNTGVCLQESAYSSPRKWLLSSKTWDILPPGSWLFSVSCSWTQSSSKVEQVFTSVYHQNILAQDKPSISPWGIKKYLEVLEADFKLRTLWFQSLWSSLPWWVLLTKWRSPDE